MNPNDCILFVRITFSNLLAEKIGKEKIIEFKNTESITVSQFINQIKKEDWAEEVLEGGYIKTPVILVIDNDLIQVSNGLVADKQITAESTITFQIMFAGGI